MGILIVSATFKKAYDYCNVALGGKISKTLSAARIEFNNAKEEHAVRAINIDGYSIYEIQIL